MLVNFLFLSNPSVHLFSRNKIENTNLFLLSLKNTLLPTTLTFLFQLKRGSKLRNLLNWLFWKKKNVSFKCFFFFSLDVKQWKKNVSFQMTILIKCYHIFSLFYFNLLTDGEIAIYCRCFKIKKSFNMSRKCIREDKDKNS